MSDLKDNSIGKENETKQHLLSLPNNKNQNHSLQATVPSANNEVVGQTTENSLAFQQQVVFNHLFTLKF